MKIAFHPGNKLPGIPGVVPKEACNNVWEFFELSKH